MIKNKPVLGWTLYDWANSAFATTIMAAVLPVYYESVAGAGLGEGVATRYWANTQTIAALVVAFMAPILGASLKVSPAASNLAGPRASPISLVASEAPTIRRAIVPAATSVSPAPTVGA